MRSSCHPGTACTTTQVSTTSRQLTRIGGWSSSAWIGKSSGNNHALTSSVFQTSCVNKGKGPRVMAAGGGHGAHRAQRFTPEHAEPAGPAQAHWTRPIAVLAQAVGAGSSSVRMWSSASSSPAKRRGSCRRRSRPSTRGYLRSGGGVAAGTAGEEHGVTGGVGSRTPKSRCPARKLTMRAWALPPMCGVVASAAAMS